MFADAGDLVFIDVGIVGDKSKLTDFRADSSSDEVTEESVLDDVVGEPQGDVGGTRGDEEVEMAVNQIPLGIPDTRGESGGGEPFVLPEGKDHAAVTGVGF